MTGPRRFKQAVKKASILILAGGLLALGGCGQAGAPGGTPATDAEAQGQAGYVVPPQVTSQGLAAGRVELGGRAAPGARVRLATPGGAALFADADAQGHWRIAMPALQTPKLFGLSMTAAGRQVQAQGYVLIMPTGEVTLLRAGAGAVTLKGGGTARITALDFDSEGGAVASGVAPADTPITLRADGRQVAEGRSDVAGRFSIAFNQPLTAGSHRVEIAGETWDAAQAFDVAPATPVAGAPYRVSGGAGVVRIDWMTPGGGLQSTLIPN